MESSARHKAPPAPSGTESYGEEASTPQGAAEPATRNESGSDVATQAREKAEGVAEQARERARQEVDRRSSEAGERVAGTATDLHSLSAALRDQGKEAPARYAEQAAERVERAGAYLREADSDRILGDVEDFGRRRPWAVLAGAALAGFAAARFLKASSRERYASRQVTPTGPSAEPAVARSETEQLVPPRTSTEAVGAR